MTSEPVYKNGAMLPDRLRLLQARHVKKCPVTGEISWPPSDAELQLIDLGLIDNPISEE